MDFFFNYRNIEQIYEKGILLEEYEKELETLSQDYDENTRSKARIQNLFRELQLKYSGDYKSDFSTFENFRTSYTRTAKKQSKDLVYLSKASFSLSEEIKLYSFMQSQTANMIERKERVKRLLAILEAVIDNNPEHEQYITFIKNTVSQIQDENIILSLTDYSKAIGGIKKEKERIDNEIASLKGQASKILYEDAIKKIRLLEHLFSILSKGFDIEKYKSLQNNVLKLKKEISHLRDSFDEREINNFNNQLTDYYLGSSLTIKHLIEDRHESAFSLEFAPFRLGLSARTRTESGNKYFTPGSMARQTHLQILVYLCMFRYLKTKFPGFLYMPLLILDSTNQAMGFEVFQEVYPTIIDFAKEIGIQTIFLSKDRIDGIAEDDFIDISNGLNKFHKKTS